MSTLFSSEMTGGKSNSSISNLAVLASIGLLIHATLCAIYRTYSTANIRQVAPCVLALTLCLPRLPADRDYLKAVQQPFAYSPFEVCAARLGMSRAARERMHKAHALLSCTAVHRLRHSAV